MAKKRTKKQKILAKSRHVNTQLVYEFHGTSHTKINDKNANTTDNSYNLGSIKKDLFKSLIIALLILISLVVIYWFS